MVDLALVVFTVIHVMKVSVRYLGISILCLTHFANYFMSIIFAKMWTCMSDVYRW